MKKLFYFLLFLQTFLFAQQPEVVHLQAWANDYTNTLSSEQLNYLNNDLRAFSDSTSSQLVLLIIPTLNGYPIEDYSYQVAKENKIGSKKNNNGILFLVVKDDRKLRIEVGYGLEGSMPDALCSSILRNEVRPYFRSGDYYQGIKQGIDAIKAATAGEYKATDLKRKKGNGKGLPTIFLIILFIIISLFFRGGGRRRGGGGFIFYGGGGGFGGFGGGSSGGGGSFGGFSGGGGSFGGGGSSGSW
ncbi:MAG: TPM domain-containing protein [Bacteroidota bacterium]|nr:TPM domain-containing protein [Bacteroidota bacterium]MDP4192490.1 TPM domain-containing protein [Bacteroidota bacterium]MDP4194903.1 TPM domain-containing protein [Bacteroidota bacterium]